MFVTVLLICHPVLWVESLGPLPFLLPKTTTLFCEIKYIAYKSSVSFHNLWKTKHLRMPFKILPNLALPYTFLSLISYLTCTLSLHTRWLIFNTLYFCHIFLIQLVPIICMHVPQVHDRACTISFAWNASFLFLTSVS